VRDVAGVLYTVGHSTRPIDEFLVLLSDAGIQTLVDVRRYPGSRRNPQFGQAALSKTLDDSGVAYRHDLRLGGRRSGSAGSPNSAWRNAAFRAYADHMASDEFHAALAELLQATAETSTVVLCAEALPQRCHRRLIADAAVLAGTPVVHLLGQGRNEEHVLHPQARLEQGSVVYRAESQLELPEP
jgi:uncharacterized protein (DUF488 family)